MSTILSSLSQEFATTF